MALSEGWFSFQAASWSGVYVTIISTQNNERKTSVAHPTTSTAFAVPADCPKQAVHHLNAAEHCLDPAHDKQQG